MHTNILFQISQEVKRIFKIVSRFLSFTKVYSEIPFSKNSFHTETSQSISNANNQSFPISEVLMIKKKLITLTSNKIKHQFYFRDLELA